MVLSFTARALINAMLAFGSVGVTAQRMPWASKRAL
jgi:hypothetical protein